MVQNDLSRFKFVSNFPLTSILVLFRAIHFISFLHSQHTKKRRDGGPLWKADG